MLPLVRSIVADISDVFRNVTGRRADLHRLLRRGPRKSNDHYSDEIAESRADLQGEYDRIWRYREELDTLGVILRNAEEGWIDFPTKIDGSEAFYSWHFGEAEISFWRYASNSVTTRKPV